MGYPRTAYFFPGRVGNGVCNNFPFPSRPGPTRHDTTGDFVPRKSPLESVDFDVSPGGLSEASRRPPGGLPEASRRPPGGLPEASRRLGRLLAASRTLSGGLPAASRRPSKASRRLSGGPRRPPGSLSGSLPAASRSPVQSGRHLIEHAHRTPHSYPQMRGLLVYIYTHICMYNIHI